MLLSVAVPTSIVVAGNKISDNVDGIAFNSNVTVVGHNKFVNVTNPHFRYTPRPKRPSPSGTSSRGREGGFEPPGPWAACQPGLRRTGLVSCPGAQCVKPLQRLGHGPGPDLAVVHRGPLFFRRSRAVVDFRHDGRVRAIGGS